MANPAAQLITRLGGIEAARAILGGERRDLLRRWIASGRIPHFRRHQIEGAAERHGIRLGKRLLDAALSKRAT